MSTELDESLVRLERQIAHRNELLRKFQERFEMVLKGRIPVIKRFCVKKIAEDLGYVECQEPRQQTDWFTAEIFVNKKFYDDALLYLASKDAILRSFELLKEKLPKEFQRLNCPLITRCCQNENTPEFIQIMEILFDSPDIDTIVNDAVASDENIAMYLGRIVWNWGYQSMKAELPRPPYGKINSH